MRSSATDARAGARKREANGLIREGLRVLEPTETIAFFCECGARDCDAVVSFVAGDYDGARSDADWMPLAPGHRPSPVHVASGTRT